MTNYKSLEVVVSSLQKKEHGNPHQDESYRKKKLQNFDNKT